MKRIFITTLMFVLLTFLCQSCSAKPTAQSTLNMNAPQIISFGECGEDIYWELDEYGLLNISGAGSMFNYKIETSPWYPWCTDITNIVISPDITNIGDFSFYNCINLASIDLPPKTNYIGYAAFYGCSSIKSIVLPDELEVIYDFAFSECTSLTNIDFSDKIVKIGREAFSYCPSITELLLPNSLKCIDRYAFCGCTKLSRIILPIHLDHFGICIFWDCNMLSEITLPENMSELPFSDLFMLDNIESIYFRGDAPKATKGLHQMATLYYIESTNGWTSPQWISADGYKYKVGEWKK